MLELMILRDLDYNFFSQFWMFFHYGFWSPWVDCLPGNPHFWICHILPVLRSLDLVFGIIRRHTSDLCIKGQIISKWIFGVVDFLQKTNENKSNWGIIVVKLNSFVRFLEEVKDTKNHFEIIWPLRVIHLVSNDFAF